MNVTAGRAVYKNAERLQASGWGVATLLRVIIAVDVQARGGRGRDLTRRMLYLPALIVALVLMACAVALLAVSREGEATFPGKNGRIAYASDDPREPYFGPIYTITPGGGGKSKVTNGLAPSYSPDGKRIAYATLHNKGNDADIYTIDVGGGGKSKVTTGGPPSYSPDGKRLVFSDLDKTSSKHPGDYEIYTVDARWGDRTQLTHNDKDEFAPSYSPDGKKIAYDAAYDGNDTELYTIDTRGGDRTRLTHNDGDEWASDYSPDGKRLVYVGFAGLNIDLAESDIYTIKVGGGGKTQVTNTDNAYEFESSYSPDGKKIAYTLYKGNAAPPVGDIYTINVGGGGKFRVTHSNKDDFDPSWGSRP